MLEKTLALRFETISVCKKQSLYAIKTLNTKLTLPSLAVSCEFCELWLVYYFFLSENDSAGLHISC
jgi:hypothetical protein